MHPKKTYELSLAFIGERSEATKQAVIQWLIGCGEESFVEGEISGVDIDFDYSMESRDQYRELGGDTTAIKIYRYDLEYLRDLKVRLQHAFGEHILCEESSLATEVWMEGWKESFRPIESKRFYVYPPWQDKRSVPDKISIEIEPGMAFGTGQHATTQLCMELIEEHCLSPQARALDVGTGTGILAIALSKLGWPYVQGTDIDPDAVHAATANAARNQATLKLSRASVPAVEEPFQLVIANILAVVLKQILDDLAAATADSGFVILSGVLVEQAEDIENRSASVGLRLVDAKERDGWWAGLLQKGGR